MTLIKRFLAAAAVTMGGLAASSALAADLDGTWVKRCAMDETMDLYRQEQLIFSDDHVTFTKVLSADPTCARLDVTFVASARYAERGASATVANAQLIDFTFSRVVATVRTSQAVSAFNQLRLCGLTDWRLGETRDVSGLICEHGLRNPVRGGALYHLFRVSSNRYYAGDQFDRGYDGSTPARRPRRLDLATPFVKQ